jgi:hypothetical protein
MFKSVTGIGDYTVGNNIGSPMFKTTGAPIFVHREYIQDIYSSINFTVTSFPINPGLVATFPWFSSVSPSFEQYIILGMLFEYRATSAFALNSTNTALGTVIMATEYNVENPIFPSKTSMEQHEFAISVPPQSNGLHPVECDSRLNILNSKYVRVGAVPTGADPRFYDHGNFCLATSGMQANSAIIGELWCTYKIQLLKPNMNIVNNDTIWGHWRDSVVGDVNGGALFGTTANLVANPFNTINVTIFGSTITFAYPPGYNFMVSYFVKGGNTTLNINTSATYTGTAVTNLFKNDTVGIVQSPEATQNSTTLSFQSTLVTTAQGGFVAYSNATLPTSVSSMDLFIVGYPSSDLTFKNPMSQQLQFLDLQNKIQYLEEQFNRTKIICDYDEKKQM